MKKKASSTWRGLGSERGTHLLTMFACTKVAKEFCKWVLDILDKEVPQQPVGNPTPEMEEEAMFKHLSSSCWLLIFGDARTPFFKRVPDDACVMSTDRFLEAISEPNGLYVSLEKFFAFIQETIKQFEQSYHFQKARAEGKSAKLRW